MLGAGWSPSWAIPIFVAAVVLVLVIDEVRKYRRMKTHERLREQMLVLREAVFAQAVELGRKPGEQWTPEDYRSWDGIEQYASRRKALVEGLEKIHRQGRTPRERFKEWWEKRAPVLAVFCGLFFLVGPWLQFAFEKQVPPPSEFNLVSTFVTLPLAWVVLVLAVAYLIRFTRRGNIGGLVAVVLIWINFWVAGLADTFYAWGVKPEYDQKVGALCRQLHQLDCPYRLLSGYMNVALDHTTAMYLSVSTLTGRTLGDVMPLTLVAKGTLMAGMIAGYLTELVVVALGVGLVLSYVTTHFQKETGPSGPSANPKA
jgi:hypothetical protein